MTEGKRKEKRTNDLLQLASPNSFPLPAKKTKKERAGEGRGKKKRKRKKGVKSNSLSNPFISESSFYSTKQKKKKQNGGGGRNKPNSATSS